MFGLVPKGTGRVRWTGGSGVIHSYLHVLTVRLIENHRIKSSSATAQDSATRIPQLFGRIPQLGFRNWDSETRIPQLGFRN